MTLAGCEWLRRFVDHVLPRSFVRLRSYGFLANTTKREKLAAIRGMIGAVVVPAQTPSPSTCTCPTCGRGVLVAHRAVTSVRRLHDTS